MEQDTRKKQSFFDRKISIANLIVITGIVLLVGVAAGSSFTPLRNFVEEKVATVMPSGDLAKKNFSLYWEVYNKLQANYVDPSKLQTDPMFYGSIKGMVDSIGDQATLFFDPTETSDYVKAQSGSYSGIGAELDFVNKSVVVVAPFDGSPAQQAGLEAQDIITTVDGKATTGKTLTQVVNEIRGDAGTKVTLTILRPRENLKKYTLSITRGNVTAPSMEIKEVKNGVAVVQISRFTDSTLNDWVSRWNGIASQLQAQESSGNLKGIVIDLRNNPGGFFDAAVMLAGDFLPKGSVVAYQRDRNGTDQSFPTATEPRFAKIPVTILVNGSSASASEIFAGAMQYYKRATILGEKTYGKGTAQIILPLTGGSSLHVTVSKWLLPNKVWLNLDNPITPDREVALNYDLRAKGTDNQMEEALKITK